jgi:hypothetical protein
MGGEAPSPEQPNPLPNLPNARFHIPAELHEVSLEQANASDVPFRLYGRQAVLLYLHYNRLHAETDTDVHIQTDTQDYMNTPLGPPASETDSPAVSIAIQLERQKRENLQKAAARVGKSTDELLGRAFRLRNHLAAIGVSGAFRFVYLGKTEQVTLLAEK